MNYTLQSNQLIFSIQDDAVTCSWSAENLPTHSPENANFFRVFLDNGVEREIAVFSRDQSGHVTKDGEKLILTYDQLTDEFGRTYDVRLRIEVTEDNGVFCFETEVENRSAEVRVNEIDCPYVELSVIAN